MAQYNQIQLQQPQDEGPQYAMQIVILTLKDRCKNFQTTIEHLERENTMLKMQSRRSEVPEGEVEELKERIVKLTEQKAKLRRDLTNVTEENRELWGRLSKTVQINRSLGGHLNKINDSLTQHTARKGVVRSTTFTQSDHNDSKNEIVSENNQISLELQDVSLKFEELRKSLNDSLGLAYFNEESGDVLNETVETHVSELRSVKERVLEQNRMFEKLLVDMQTDALTCVCKCKKRFSRKILEEDLEEELQLQSLAKWGTPDNSDIFLRENSPRNCCPMCGVEFPHLEMADFVSHVESHFRLT